MAGNYRVSQGRSPWEGPAQYGPPHVQLTAPSRYGYVQQVNGLGQGEPPKVDAGVGAYATASLLGSAAGGALIGYLSAADTEGAVTGGLFTTGLAGIADAFLFAREGQTQAVLPMLAIGLGTLSWALFRFGSQIQGAGGARRSYRAV